MAPSADGGGGESFIVRRGQSGCPGGRSFSTILNAGCIPHDAFVILSRMPPSRGTPAGGGLQPSYVTGEMPATSPVGNGRHLPAAGVATWPASRRARRPARRHRAPRPWRLLSHSIGLPHRVAFPACAWAASDAPPGARRRSGTRRAFPPARLSPIPRGALQDFSGGPSAHRQRAGATIRNAAWRWFPDADLSPSSTARPQRRRCSAASSSAPPVRPRRRRARLSGRHLGTC